MRNEQRQSHISFSVKTCKKSWPNVLYTIHVFAPIPPSHHRIPLLSAVSFGRFLIIQQGKGGGGNSNNEWQKTVLDARYSRHYGGGKVTFLCKV